MPLKHLTETLVIIALAIVTIVMAVLVHSAPPFPTGFVPLLLLFGAGLVYAAALSPMLRRNRADYPLRLLHLAPALISLLALVFGFVGRSFPAVKPAITAVSYGLFLPLVVLVFLLIAAFCLTVIRRRWPRLISLGVLLALFIPVAVLSQKSTWDEALGATVWGIAMPGRPVATNSSSSTTSSVLKNGETWSERLKNDLAKRRGDMPLRSSQSSSPSKLPSSGPEMPFIFLVVAGYCTVVHARAKKRMMEA